jgi:hypothetical protein
MKIFRKIPVNNLLLFITLSFALTLINLLKLPSYNNIAGVAYKDAANWELCSKSLSLFGTFPENISDWCLRRPINIELLSTMFRLTSSIMAVKTILNFLFVLVLIWSYSKFNKLLSKFESIFLSFGIYILWITFANNMLLSETIAIIIGTLSVGIFAKIIIKFTSADFCTFLICQVLIQLIRPGNLLLPFLTILLIPIISNKLREKLAITCYVLVLPIIYSLIIKITAVNFGYKTYLTGGNAWASFYGLVNNNSTWQSAYSSVPISVGSSEIQINEYLRDVTISTFKEHPLHLFISIFENLRSMFMEVFPFVSPTTFNIPTWLRPLFLIFYLIILARIFSNLRKSNIGSHINLFSGFAILSILLFYALTWKSEAARALAPTLPLFAFVALLFIRKRINLEGSNSGDKIIEKIDFRKNMKHGIYLLVPALIISSLIALNRTPLRISSIDSQTPKCLNGDFGFDYKSLIFADIRDIKSFKAFGWSQLINDLPDGYLVQGLVKIQDKPFALTAYLKSQSQIPDKSFKSNCFVFVENSSNFNILSTLNFKEIKFSSS